VPVSRVEVEAMAALARLRLEPEQAGRMAAELNDILAHMDQLRSADTASVEAFSVAAADVAPPRPDVAGADSMGLPPAVNAPAWEEGFFTVPRLEAQRRPGPQGDGSEGAGA
jgi:aspartyl-tRNA(Asn)/glutamyl-tRNA(Gln) amidotransferase subunit C